MPKRPVRKSKEPRELVVSFEVLGACRFKSNSEALTWAAEILDTVAGIAHGEGIDFEPGAPFAPEIRTAADIACADLQTILRAVAARRGDGPIQCLGSEHAKSAAADGRRRIWFAIGSVFAETKQLRRDAARDALDTLVHHFRDQEAREEQQDRERANRAAA